MIVWSGFGFLTAVICIVGILIGNSLLSSVPYHFEIGLLLAAVTNWFVGKKLNSVPGKILKDEQTGEVFEYKRNHTLFWLPMEWWSVGMTILAIVGIFSNGK